MARTRPPGRGMHDDGHEVEDDPRMGTAGTGAGGVYFKRIGIAAHSMNENDLRTGPERACAGGRVPFPRITRPAYIERV